MDIRYLQRIFNKRKWLILIVVAVACIATYLIALRLPDQYRAETLLGTGFLTTGMAEIADKEDFQALQYEAESQINTVIDMIRSNQVIHQVSYRLILHDLNESPPFRSLQNLSKFYEENELRAAAAIYQTKLDSIQPLLVPGEKENLQVEILKVMGYDLGSILNDLTIERDRDTDLIRISFESSNPYLAAFVVNTLCEEFVRFYETVKIKRVRNTIDFYSRLAVEKKQQLNEVILAQEDFVPIMSPTLSASQAQELMIRKRQLELLRSEEESRVRALERTLTSINQVIEAEGMDNMGEVYDQRMVALRDEIADANRRLINAVASNDPFAPIADTLRILRNQLDRRLINNALISFTSSGNQSQRLSLLKRDRELALSHSREVLQQLDMELDEIRDLLIRQESDAQALQMRNEQVQTAREEYISILEQLNEARYMSLDQESNISQVEYAQPPDQPIPARRWLLVGLAALSSFSLCVLTLITLEILDISIKNSSHLERLTGLPVLGNLNFLRAEKLDLVSLFNDTTQDFHLETYKHLMRKIRFEIVSSGANTFMFTSTKPGTGKTSLLLSVGYSISLNHKKVLLIDTNFKNNQLTRVCSANPTLERYVAGEIPMSNLISHSGLEGVEVIGCEGGNYSPSEALAPPEKFEDLLQQLSQTYDFIFFEGPALNFYSDSQELLRYADKVLPIFSAKTTIKQADKTSIKFLRQYEDKLMGSILNMVEIEDLED